jgi:hypothetical protein
LTPSITPTVSITPTPSIPIAIGTRFTSLVTPNPDAIFSPMKFAREIKGNQPVNPAVEFAPPVGHLYATFTYDKVVSGVQWTALWYRVGDHELLCFETKPWDGGTGGYGYSDCEPAPEKWLAGEYEVQLFIGMTWKVSSRFTVSGPTLTPRPSGTQVITMTVTPIPTISLTPTTTSTRLPTFTNTVTVTLRPTETPRPTDTRMPTATESPTPP